MVLSLSLSLSLSHTHTHTRTHTHATETKISQNCPWLGGRHSDAFFLVLLWFFKKCWSRFTKLILGLTRLLSGSVGCGPLCVKLHPYIRCDSWKTVGNPAVVTWHRSLKIFCFGCVGSLLQHMAFLNCGRQASLTVAQGLSCPTACGILFPWQGIKAPSSLPAPVPVWNTTERLWRPWWRVWR